MEQIIKEKEDAAQITDSFVFVRHPLSVQVNSGDDVVSLSFKVQLVSYHTLHHTADCI